MCKPRFSSVRRDFFAVFLPVFVVCFALLFVGCFRAFVMPGKVASAIFQALAVSFFPACAFGMFGCLTSAVIRASRVGVKIPWSIKIGTVLLIIYACTVCICVAFHFMHPLVNRIIQGGSRIVLVIVIVPLAVHVLILLFRHCRRGTRQEGNDTEKPA
jgi:hypothetical protein